MNTYRTSSELYDERQNWQIERQEERESYVESYGDKAMTTDENRQPGETAMRFRIPEGNGYREQLERLDRVDEHCKQLVVGYNRSEVAGDYTFTASASTPLHCILVKGILVRHYGFELVED